MVSFFPAALRRFLPLLLLLSAILPLAAEEDPTVTVSSMALKPMNRIHWERWCEVAITVRNEGETERKLQAVVDMPQVKNGLLAMFSRPLVLAPKTQTEHKLMVRFPALNQMPSRNEKGFPIRVRLMERNNAVVDDVFLKPAFTGQGISILWIDHEDPNLVYALAKALPKSKIGALKDAGMTMTRSEQLPHHSMGFDPYDLVVLSTWTSTGLDPLQTEALLNWTRRGGKFLVIGGTNGFPVQNRELTSALPLWPEQYFMVSTIPEVEKEFGDLGIQDGIGLLDGARAPGSRILRGSEDVPLLMSKRLGLGTIYQLNINLLRNDKSPTPGMLAFVGDTLRVAVDPPGRIATFPAEAQQAVLQQLIASKVVEPKFIGAWLGGFLVVVIGCLIGLRFTKRPEFGYAGLALASLVFFVLLFQLSRRQRTGGEGQTTRARAFIAETRSGESSVVVRAIESFYPPKEENVDGTRASLESFEAVLAPRPDPSVTRPEVVSLETYDRMSVQSWRLSPNAIRSLSVQSLLVPSKSRLAYAGHLTREGLRLDIHPDLAMPLEQPFVKWNRFVLRLPELAGKKEVKVDTWNSRNAAGQYEGNLSTREEKARNALRQSIIPDALRSVTINTKMMDVVRGAADAYQVVLVGYSSGDPLWETSPDAASATSQGLWAFHGDSSLLTADDQFFLPAGVADMNLHGPEGRIAYFGHGNFGGVMTRQEFPLYFRMPECIRNSKPEKIQLYANFDSLQYNLTLRYAYGLAGKLPDNKEWKTISVAREMTLPLPSGGFTPEQDSIWVKITVELAEGKTAKEGSASDTQRWRLGGLDVSVRGRKN